MNSIIRDAAHLAVVLKAARNHANFTQSVVGKKVGLQQKTISRLESSQLGGCSVDSLLKALTALNLELVVRSAPSADSRTATAQEDW